MKNLKKVKGFFKEWIFRTGLGYWHIHIRYRRTGDCPAQVTAKWEYQIAWIDVSVKDLKGMDDWDLEMMVIHELAHILIVEIQKKRTKHLERVATQVAKALYWTKYNRKTL